MCIAHFLFILYYSLLTRTTHANMYREEPRHEPFLLEAFLKNIPATSVHGVLDPTIFIRHLDISGHRELNVVLWCIDRIAALGRLLSSPASARYALWFIRTSITHKPQIPYLLQTCSYTFTQP